MGNSQFVTIETVTMTKQEAQEWKGRVKEQASQLRSILYEGYKRQVWIPLGHANWSECVRAIADEFGFSEVHIWRLHSANQTQDNLLTNWLVDEMIPESQLRPLTSLEPEQQREAWEQAVRTAPNGKVTAAHVERVVNEIIGKPQQTETKPDIKMAVHFSSDTPEWYTPPAIIERTLKVIGKIDLDPCSNSKTSPNVKAKRHYTIEDDGLSQKWAGRVYMNPPYGREIEDWIIKLCESHESGDVTEAIALVPARVDTQWWNRLRNYPVCFVSGRLKFGDAENSAPFPSAVVYLGNEIDKFYYAFCDLGDIWQRIEPGMFGE